MLIIDLTSVPYLDQTACKAFIEWLGSVDEKAHFSLVAPEGKFLHNDVSMKIHSFKRPGILDCNIKQL